VTNCCDGRFHLACAAGRAPGPVRCPAPLAGCPERRRVFAAAAACSQPTCAASAGARPWRRLRRRRLRRGCGWPAGRPRPHPYPCGRPRLGRVRSDRPRVAASRASTGPGRGGIAAVAVLPSNGPGNPAATRVRRSAAAGADPATVRRRRLLHPPCPVGRGRGSRERPHPRHHQGRQRLDARGAPRPYRQSSTHVPLDFPRRLEEHEMSRFLVAMSTVPRTLASTLMFADVGGDVVLTMRYPEWFTRFGEIPGVEYTNQADLDVSKLRRRGERPRLHRLSDGASVLTWPVGSCDGSQSPSSSHILNDQHNASTPRLLRNLAEALELPAEPSTAVPSRRRPRDRHTMTTDSTAAGTARRSIKRRTPDARCPNDVVPVPLAPTSPVGTVQAAARRVRPPQSNTPRGVAGRAGAGVAWRRAAVYGVEMVALAIWVR
jgi:hypothetical protein